MCFHNDTPLNLESDILPFGKTPKVYDTFYIASQECFSKKGEKISMTFTLNTIGTTQNVFLSWEYWNGKSWMAIEDLDYKFKTSDPISFTCPEDIEPNEVNGEMNYWLKIKILDGGYGEVKYLLDDKSVSVACRMEINSNKNYFTISNILPPKITDIKIEIKNSEGRFLDKLLAFNALEFKDITTINKRQNSKTFKLFNPLEDEKQTIFFGFDQKLEKGPICLFLSIDEYPWPENNLPRVKWYYYNENDEWASLDVIDKIQGLTRSDVVEFVLPSDFKRIKKFGKDLFWIKAVDVENRLKLQTNGGSGQSYLRKQNKGDVGVKPCPSLIELFNPRWSFPDSTQWKAHGPLLRGIYLNTTWGVQWESIKDEVMGSSDGTALQSFKTLKSPVVSEEVWVNEFNTILESEIEEIINDKEFEVNEVHDLRGNLIEFWVRWKAEEDILFAADERCYEIDHYSGELKFGNGNHGRIPPIGSDNIKINYHTGGGSNGNLPANEIKSLKSTIASVDKVYNPLPSEGGSNVENINKLIDRGSKRLKNRNRAITIEDYEEVAKEASQSIARVKCLPNFDEKGQNNPGHVTALIIPQSLDDRPKLSLELKKQVENYLYNRSPNTMILEVSEPVYVGVSVNLHIIALTANAISYVEKEAHEQLKRFLNPLIGGFDGNGWAFGRMPCISDFYNLLENMDNVNYVKDISVTLMVSSGQEYILTPDKNVEVRLTPYSMIYSSTHTVNVGINMEDV
mgnify:FL=1|jgi:hypothetical protein